MPTERLSMRKTKEILRLKWQHGRSHREIARALAVGVGTPSDVAKRALAANLTTWDAIAALSGDRGSDTRCTRCVDNSRSYPHKEYKLCLTPSYSEHIARPPAQERANPP